MSRLRSAIFLDTDSVLVQRDRYNVAPEGVMLSRGASTGLPLLYASGFRLLIVSSQAGIAHGYYTEAELRPFESRLRQLLADIGAPADGFYYCPHHPQGTVRRHATSCYCRKPRSGLLRQAAGDLKLDLGASWLIGALLDDVEAAHNAGSRGMLLDNGMEQEWRTDEGRRPDGIADDLAEAALLIASSARGGIRA